MKLPRFKVRTLLVVTTIAAFVVATLAPWLRLMTWEIAITIYIRTVCFLLGGLWASELGRNLAGCANSSKPYSSTLFTIRQSSKFVIVILLFLFHLLLVAAVEYQVAMQSGSRGHLEVFFATLFFWVSFGMIVALCLHRVLQARSPVQLIDEGLLADRGLLEWNRLRRFEWHDLDQGRLLIDLGRFATDIYYVPPAEVGAVDAFLQEKLHANIHR